MRTSHQQQTITSSPTASQSDDPDWTIIGLGIGALIMLLGLIPLWFMVYRAWAR